MDNPEVSKARTILYNNLLKIAHKDYDPMVADLETALTNDPDFVSRACVSIATTGSNRDLADCAIITLLQAPPLYNEYREAGRCLLLGKDVYDIEPDGIGGLPPYRIFRVDEYIRKSDKKVPRLMKSIMTDWTNKLSWQDDRFDGIVMRNRSAMKRMYKHYHITPTDRAQSILFLGKPPEGSKMAVLKQIAASKDPKEQARLVMEHKIPYVVAASVLPKLSPAVAVALIDVMTPQEALNSRHWVEESGILNIPEVKEAYLDKVGKATASAASVDFRKSAQGTDEDVAKAATRAKERAVAQGQRITRSTLLLVDISGSMESAIETAIQFGSRIAPICDGELKVILFNDYAREIVATGTTLTEWQRMFKGIRAGGGTSMMAGLQLAMSQGFMAEQIVVVTDGGENQGNFANYLKALESTHLYSPHIVVIRVQEDMRAPNVFSQRVADAGFRMDDFYSSGQDYYVYDQVAAVLGGPPAKSLIQKILDTQLPHRKGWMRQ